MKKQPQGQDEVLYDGTFYQMIRRNVQDRNGNPYGWEMVKRKTPGRIIAIVGLTDAHEVILVKIYRVPLQGYVLEACAGLMDAGESEEDTARRELLEETGYTVESIEPLLEGPFDTGLVEDEFVYFVGTGARKQQEPTLEAIEDIETITVPLQNMSAFLSSPPPQCRVDIKLFGVLHRLQERFGTS